MSIFETFIYWAQKYNVTIYLNENTSLYLLRNPKNTTWRGLLTNLSDKKRNLMRKSHTIIQSLNIVPIDKLKSSIAPNFGNPLEEENDIEENDIEENDTEEDDFGEETNFSSGRNQAYPIQYQTWKREQFR